MRVHFGGMRGPFSKTSAAEFVMGRAKTEPVDSRTRLHFAGFGSTKMDSSAAFTVNFPVRYQDTDFRLHATPAAVVGAMQEAAILHSESVGRGIAWLREHSFAWMIVQTRARVIQQPDWRTLLQVTTWPSEMGRLLSRREFALSDPSGKRLVQATTLWAFVNRATQRVMRIPPEILSAFRVSPDRALALPFGRPAPCTVPAWEQSFSIGRREIDSNGHVNNLRYLEWMIEALPGDVLEGWTLRELNLRYQRETGPGGLVRSQTSEVPGLDNPARRFAHRVLDDAGECVATAETSWSKADVPLQ